MSLSSLEATRSDYARAFASMADNGIIYDFRTLYSWPPSPYPKEKVAIEHEY